RDLGVDLLDFCPVLLGYVTRENLREDGEDVLAWNRILGSGRTVMPDFDADTHRVEDADPLGVDDDVRAFATLICLDQAAPLSIGLFGAWGSGKSTFMDRLYDQVRKFSDREKARRKKTPARPPDNDKPQRLAARFAANVVQIKFNAWQFADSNLWASLTAEFF